MYLFAVTVEIDGKIIGYIVQADTYDDARMAISDLHPGVEPTIQELAKNVAYRVFKTWREVDATNPC